MSEDRYGLSALQTRSISVSQSVAAADTKYKMDLKDKKPTIKAIAIAYCAQKASLKEPADEQ